MLSDYDSPPHRPLVRTVRETTQIHRRSHARLEGCRVLLFMGIWQFLLFRALDLEEDNVSHLEPEELKYYQTLARQ